MNINIETFFLNQNMKGPFHATSMLDFDKIMKLALQMTSCYIASLKLKINHMHDEKCNKCSMWWHPA